MLFSYFGGKRNQSPWIYSQITEEMKKNTKTFTEVFSGVFWVYFNNDFTFADKIIYNDMNVYLTNFFATCSHPEFIEKLEHELNVGSLKYDPESFTTPKEAYDHYYSYFKTMFYKIREELMLNHMGEEVKVNMPDIELAFKYSILLRHAFSGLSNEKAGYSYSSASYKDGKKCPKPKSQHLRKLFEEDKMLEKISKVTSFETLDFADHINKYDSPETLFYIDPPYFSTEKQYYRGDDYFGNAGHKKLADQLNQIEGKFILSYYDFEGLSDFYPKDKFRWEEKAFTKASTSTSKKSIDKKQGHEVLIMNYPIES
jgi:DNA adenine methylase